MNEIKKVSKLVDEITTFYMEHRAKDININVQTKNDGTYIKSYAQNLNISREELHEIEHVINNQSRESEMEQYYWSLAGDGHSSADLLLVAVMVDNASITYDKENDQVNISLFRKN